MLSNPSSKSLQPAGLKVIYGFLCNPGLENKHIERLLAETDVRSGP